MDFELEIQKTNVGIRINIFEILCVPIVIQNWQFWLFQRKFPKKWILGLEFWKTKSGCRISSKISCVPIFRQNGQLLLFCPKFAQKRILGSEFGNSKPGFGISTSYIPWGPILRQNEQFWIFGLNFGKLLNYVWYFGSYNVERVKENWVEA